VTSAQFAELARLNIGYPVEATVEGGEYFVRRDGLFVSGDDAEGCIRLWLETFGGSIEPKVKP